MELAWCKYKTKESTKYMLLLIIGTYNGKIHCIESEAISELEKKLIRKRWGQLNSMDGKSLIEWIKANCPTILLGYKTIDTQHLTVMKRYAIKEI